MFDTNLQVLTMALQRVEAIIIRTYALGDTSRIAVLYTREMGLLRAVAKGARQPRSRFGGGLEPLTRVIAHVYLKEGRDLHLLSSIDPIESHTGVGDNLERMTHAQAAAEFIDRLVWGEEAHEALYLLLSDTLRLLASAPGESLSTVTLAFQLQATALLGYRPVLERCSACDREQNEWRHFAPSRGGVVCNSCAAQEGLVIRISRHVTSELGRLSAVDLTGDAPPAAARAGELLRLVEVYLQSHFQKFSGLRSLELLRGLEAASGGEEG